ncbi:MAG TPA: 50S ribosomal protein L6 [Pseudogracilibacillus sp.]|nr:50S ribosomal protein L6 [Pseudogracilibacillus sp.]
MSRIGFRPIEIPEGVDVKLDGETITVKGPKGELNRTISPTMDVKIDGDTITVERQSEDKQTRSLHGTTRSLINNMIEGVTKGFQKELEIIGVGYRAQLQGNKLVIGAGYSHPVEIEKEENIEFEVPQNTQIIIKGIDKEQVGRVAANIRAIRAPEPYKGKGIRYKDEYVRRKEGKTAK